MSPTTALGLAISPSLTSMRASVPLTGLKIGCSPTIAIGLGSTWASLRSMCEPGPESHLIGPSL